MRKESNSHRTSIMRGSCSPEDLGKSGTTAQALKNGISYLQKSIVAHNDKLRAAKKKAGVSIEKHRKWIAEHKTRIAAYKAKLKELA